MAKGQVAVLGLGRFGQRVARDLQLKGIDVLAIDKDPNRVRESAALLQHVMVADVSDRAALIELSVPESESVIVAVGGDIQTNLLTTVLLKTLGAKNVVARARDELHGDALRQLGADRVVFPELDTAERLAHSLSFRGVQDYFELSRDYGISTVVVNDGMAGRTIEELGLVHPRQANELSVVLIIRNRNEALIQPDRFEKVGKGDVLVLAGLDKEFEELQFEQFDEKGQDGR
ncbi:MAG: TrkA family potassium uptake protein [Chloroflexi bacterium]|nr:TrkA family potassium uptake protein [Chloroflexota bacterium]